MLTTSPVCKKLGGLFTDCNQTGWSVGFSNVIIGTSFHFPSFNIEKSNFLIMQDGGEIGEWQDLV